MLISSSCRTTKISPGANVAPLRDPRNPHRTEMGRAKPVELPVFSYDFSRMFNFPLDPWTGGSLGNVRWSLPWIWTWVMIPAAV